MSRVASPQLHLPKKDDIEDLSYRSTVTFREALERLTRAILSGDQEARQAAFRGLQVLLGQTMTLADFMGRRRMVLEAKAAEKRVPPELRDRIIFAQTPVVPRVPFVEAVEDLIARTPEIIDPSITEGRWREVAALYQDRHAFALAKSTELELTKKIQAAITRSLKRGQSAPKTEDIIANLGGWTRGYAETVYRTNLNTAFTAGRFRMAQAPSVTKVIGGFEFRAIMDGDTRPNHAAAHGLVASQFDPIWETYSPPMGYSCRCHLRMVDRFELRQRHLLKASGEVIIHKPASFSEAYPDEGFERKHRPDRAIYG